MRHVIKSCSTFLPSTIKLFQRVYELQSGHDIYSTALVFFQNHHPPHKPVGRGFAWEGFNFSIPRWFHLGRSTQNYGKFGACVNCNICTSCLSQFSLMSFLLNINKASKHCNCRRTITNAYSQCIETDRGSLR